MTEADMAFKMLECFMTETNPTARAQYWRAYLNMAAKCPGAQITWDAVNKGAWTVAQKVAPRLATREYVARLLQTFGKLALGDMTESAGVRTATTRGIARGATGTAVRGLTGWPCLVVVAVMSIGCDSANQRDENQARQQAYELYKQYTLRYGQWAMRRLAQKPNAHIEPPWLFEEFLENQNTMKMPS
jgi:hypothetical protein